MPVALALWLDRRLQLTIPNTPLPIFVRYVSLATENLKERPHWIFVGAMTILCPCVVTVSFYVAAIGRDVEPGDISWIDGIESRGMLAGFVGPILAAFPMGTALGTLIHVGACVAFLMASLGWSGNVLYVAYLWSSFDPTWDVVQSVFGILGWVAVGLIGASFFFAMKGTQLLALHQSSPEQHRMSSKQIMFYRLAETGLAMGEISQALIIGGSLLACTVVLADLSEKQMEESDAGIYGGIAAAYAFAVAVSFNATNSFFINRCQSRSTTNDDGDEREIGEGSEKSSQNGYEEDCREPKELDSNEVTIRTNAS